MAAYTRAAPREGRGAGSRSPRREAPAPTLAAGRGGAAAVRPRRVRGGNAVRRAVAARSRHSRPARAGRAARPVCIRPARRPLACQGRLDRGGAHARGRGPVVGAGRDWSPTAAAPSVTRSRSGSPAAAGCRCASAGSRAFVSHWSRAIAARCGRSGPSPRLPASRRSSRAPAGARTRRCGVPHRATPRPCTWSSCTTRTRPTATRPTTCRRSSVRSTPTTCARTAGTTLATTSSSTPTGASSRVAPAASTAPSSARTRRASTPAAWASP